MAMEWKEDEHIDHFIGVDIEEESWFDLGVCCWDPRYDGPPNFCACKAESEERYRSLPWYSKIELWVRNYSWELKRWVKDIFRAKKDKNELPF